MLGVPDGQLQLGDLGVQAGAAGVVGLLLEALALVVVAGLDALVVRLDRLDRLVQLGGVLPRLVVQAVPAVVLRGRDGADLVTLRRFVLVPGKERADS